MWFGPTLLRIPPSLSQSVVDVVRRYPALALTYTTTLHIHAPALSRTKSPSFSQSAVDVVRRYPALAQEPSQRYARALLDRELSVLLLSEAMLMADSEEAARERQAAEEQLKKHRQEAREVEVEYQRVDAEGPASHRKRDLLDKATKEAEHRERLQDLQTRLTGLSERMVVQENSRQKWSERLLDAERDLEVVRSQLRQHATRKRHLEEICAQLDSSAPPGTDPANNSGPFIVVASGRLQQRLQQQLQLQLQIQQQLSEGTRQQAVASGDETSVPPGTIAVAARTNTAAGVADMEFRAQRLECLMYRVLWVSETVKTFQMQYSPHSGSPHYELFIRATNWAKGLADDFDDQIKSWVSELDKIRLKLQEAACVDLAYDLTAYALEFTRLRIEASARLAREQASLALLLELEQDEKASGLANSNTNSSANNKKQASKKQKVAEKLKEKKEKDEQERLAELAEEAVRKEAEVSFVTFSEFDFSCLQAKLAEEAVRKEAEEAEKRRLAHARQQREAIIEAELEGRRKELDELEALREAEAIEKAQLVSLLESRRPAKAAAAVPQHPDPQPPRSLGPSGSGSSSTAAAASRSTAADSDPLAGQGKKGVAKGGTNRGTPAPASGHPAVEEDQSTAVLVATPEKPKRNAKRTPDLSVNTKQPVNKQRGGAVSPTAHHNAKIEPSALSDSPGKALAHQDQQPASAVAASPNNRNAKNGPAQDVPPYQADAHPAVHHRLGHQQHVPPPPPPPPPKQAVPQHNGKDFPVPATRLGGLSMQGNSMQGNSMGGRAFGSNSATFDPFAENPILRALGMSQAALSGNHHAQGGQAVGAGRALQAPMNSSASHPALSQLLNQSEVRSPGPLTGRSPGRSLVSVDSFSSGVPAAADSPRSGVTSVPICPSPPCESNVGGRLGNSVAQEPDHIMSIMSILEPDQTSSVRTDFGGRLGAAGAKEAAYGQGGMGRLYDSSPTAAATAVADRVTTGRLGAGMNGGNRLVPSLGTGAAGGGPRGGMSAFLPQGNGVQTGMAPLPAYPSSQMMHQKGRPDMQPHNMTTGPMEKNLPSLSFGSTIPGSSIWSTSSQSATWGAPPASPPPALARSRVNLQSGDTSHQQRPHQGEDLALPSSLLEDPSNGGGGHPAFGIGASGGASTGGHHIPTGHQIPTGHNIPGQNAANWGSNWPGGGLAQGGASLGGKPHHYNMQYPDRQGTVYNPPQASAPNPNSNSVAGAGGRYGLGLYSGEAGGVNWGNLGPPAGAAGGPGVSHLDSAGRSTNSTWAPFNGPPPRQPPGAKWQQQQQQQQQRGGR
eukprot:gene31763-6961_t